MVTNERKAAAAMLLAFISKVSMKPWSEDDLAGAEAVVEAIATAVRVEPTDHQKAVAADRKKKS